MQRAHRRAHRRIWLALAFLLPAVILAGLALRRNGGSERGAVLLVPPAAEPAR